MVCIDHSVCFKLLCNVQYRVMLRCVFPTDSPIVAFSSRWHTQLILISNSTEALRISYALVNQVCSEDGMEFTLRTPEPFVGRIYTYGFYDRCFYRGNGGTVNVLRISGAQGYPDCGTQRVQSLHHNTSNKQNSWNFPNIIHSKRWESVFGDRQANPGIWSYPQYTYWNEWNEIRLNWGEVGTRESLLTRNLEVCPIIIY